MERMEQKDQQVIKDQEEIMVMMVLKDLKEMMDIQAQQDLKDPREKLVM